MTLAPLLADGKPIVVPKDQLTDISPSGMERRLVSEAITRLELWSTDPESRMAAVQKAGNGANSALIPSLEEVAADKDASEKVRRMARESTDVIRIQSFDTKPEDRQSAARDLGQMRSARGEAILNDRLEHMAKEAAEIARQVADKANKAGEFAKPDLATAAQSKPDTIEVRLPTTSPEVVQKVEAALTSLDLSALSAKLKEPKSSVEHQQTVLEYELVRTGSGKVDSDLKPGYQAAVAQIESYQRLVRGLGYIRDGISQGSILILMALGLAITFGVMGVINMAHGELMMIGAFATYFMQQFFVKTLPASMFNWYFVAALPVAFLTAAIAGYLIEMLVVRFLYGRALDTLLATWGVSLILIQGVRVIFGNNIGVNAPTWFRGGFEVMQDLVLPLQPLLHRCLVRLVRGDDLRLVELHEARTANSRHDAEPRNGRGAGRQHPPHRRLYVCPRRRHRWHRRLRIDLDRRRDARHGPKLYRRIVPGGRHRRRRRIGRHDLRRPRIGRARQVLRAVHRRRVGASAGARRGHPVHSASADAGCSRRRGGSPMSDASLNSASRWQRIYAVARNDCLLAR